MEVIGMYAHSRPTITTALFAIICFALLVPRINAGDWQSTTEPESAVPAITIQDQSRRLLSPGFRLQQVPSSATGKQKAELHLEDDRIYGEQNLFRSNKPPLLLKTAAYGLSQAVKLADHKITDHRHPLLIDAMTSRDTSLVSPEDQAAACKYCRSAHSAVQASAAPEPSRKCLTDYESQTAVESIGTESKSVQELVDLMESLGPGVLQGSVFGLGDLVADDQLDARQALIQNLEVLDVQNRNPAACRYCSERISREDVPTEADSANPWFDASPDALMAVAESSETAKSVMVRIDALRSSAEKLDEAANQLERRDLFYQSDQLRELSSQLRADARNARVALMAQPGFETEVPEVDREEAPNDFRPVAHSRVQFLEEQLDQLRKATQMDHGSRLR